MIKSVVSLTLTFWWGWRLSSVCKDPQTSYWVTCPFLRLNRSTFLGLAARLPTVVTLSPASRLAYPEIPTKSKSKPPSCLTPLLSNPLLCSLVNFGCRVYDRLPYRVTTWIPEGNRRWRDSGKVSWQRQQYYHSIIQMNCCSELPVTIYLSDSDFFYPSYDCLNNKQHKNFFCYHKSTRGFII